MELALVKWPYIWKNTPVISPDSVVHVEALASTQMWTKSPAEDPEEREGAAWGYLRV